MTVDELIDELGSVSSVLMLASHLPFPGAKTLVAAAAALTALAQDRALVQSIFDKVNYGIDLIHAVAKWLDDKGYQTAARYLTTVVP